MYRRFPARALETVERRTLFATLVVDGTAGDDVIVIHVEKELIEATLNGNTMFFLDDAYDAVDVRGLGGDDAIAITSIGDNDLFVRGDAADGVTGPAGDDSIDIAEGNLDAVNSTTVITAGGGHDVVRLNDQNNLFGDAFAIGDTRAWRPFFVGVNYGTDLEALVLRASLGGSAIDVTMTAALPRVTVDAGFGTDSIVVDTTMANPVTLLPAAGDDNVAVEQGEVVFDGTQRIGVLGIAAGATASIAPAGDDVLTMTGLTFDAPGGGRLDLRDNAAVIDYAGISPIDSVRAALATGYANGAWTGPGIMSSTAAAGSTTAVGYAESTDLFTQFPAEFAGQSVDGTSILLRHTLYGDADLNRTVNLNDFNRLAANFGQSQRRWSHGNFDFNDTVNLSDFNRLAANFGQSLA